MPVDIYVPLGLAEQEPRLELMRNDIIFKADGNKSGPPTVRELNDQAEKKKGFYYKSLFYHPLSILS